MKYKFKITDDPDFCANYNLKFAYSILSEMLWKMNNGYLMIDDSLNFFGMKDDDNNIYPLFGKYENKRALTLEDIGVDITTPGLFTDEACILTDFEKKNIKFRLRAYRRWINMDKFNYLYLTYIKFVFDRWDSFFSDKLKLNLQSKEKDLHLTFWHIFNNLNECLVFRRYLVSEKEQNILNSAYKRIIFK